MAFIIIIIFHAFYMHSHKCSNEQEKMTRERAWNKSQNDSPETCSLSLYKPVFCVNILNAYYTCTYIFSYVSADKRVRNDKIKNRFCEKKNKDYFTCFGYHRLHCVLCLQYYIYVTEMLYYILTKIYWSINVIYTIGLLLTHIRVKKNFWKNKSY